MPFSKVGSKVSAMSTLENKSDLKLEYIQDTLGFALTGWDFEFCAIFYNPLGTLPLYRPQYFIYLFHIWYIYQPYCEHESDWF